MIQDNLLVLIMHHFDCDEPSASLILDQSEMGHQLDELVSKLSMGSYHEFL